MLPIPGQYTLSTKTQNPRHTLGARVEGHMGTVFRYARALESITRGQLVGPRVYATISTGITAAANTRTFTSSGSTFTKRVTRPDGTVTTWEAPAIGSILHVSAGTGKEQFARVTDVLSTTKLGVKVIGRTNGTWGTALAATDTVRIVEPCVVQYDVDDAYGLPPYGYALGTIASGDFAYFLARGVGECVPNTTVAGVRLIPSPTAGQVEPCELFGSATWDAGAIADGDEEAKEVTVTGAALGDFVQASLSIDVADLALVAAVTAANTVTALLLNNTGGAIDLASATIYVHVDKRFTAARTFDCGVLLSAPGTAGDQGLVLCDLLSGVEGNWYF